MAKGDVIISTPPETIRLDCLRVAALRLDLDPERVVERASVFEKYVTGKTTRPKPETASGEPKGDNPLS